jgi:hypothetical protein
MNSKGYKMDLLRYEFISENSYLFDYSFPAKNPYFEQVEYILIEQLIKNILTAGHDINSTVYNKLMDISYILLILGDDFLPTIPNINVKNIDDIISVYNEYIKEEGPGRKLVNKNIIYSKDGKYLLNFEGFKKFLEKMAVKKIQISRDSPMKSLDDNKLNFLESRVSKNLKNANEDYDKAKNYYFITETSEIVFKKKFFYNKGIVMNDSGEVASYKNLLTINKPDYLAPAIPDMIKKYCEGCSFILDIYFNNNLQNYYWYYPYEKSPRMEEIAKYIKENIIDGDPSKKINRYISIFNYYSHPAQHNLNSKAKSFKYFTKAQYVQYSDEIKNKILISIRERINTERTKKGLPIYLTNDDAFIYENIEIIYKCMNQVYFNKCIDYHIDLSDALTKPSTSISKDNFMGGYYEKYLKYKLKYLKLKEILSNNIV